MQNFQILSKLTSNTAKSVEKLLKYMKVFSAYMTHLVTNTSCTLFLLLSARKRRETSWKYCNEREIKVNKH